MDLAACKYQILSSSSLYPFLGCKIGIKLRGAGNKEGMCRAEGNAPRVRSVRRSCCSEPSPPLELLPQPPTPHSPEHKHFPSPRSQLTHPSQDVPRDKFQWKNDILTLQRGGLGRKMLCYYFQFHKSHFIIQFHFQFHKSPLQCEALAPALFPALDVLQLPFPSW